MERSIVAALVLSAFSLIVLYIILSPTAEVAQSSVKEAFVNKAATRASLCNCLPGYIPSTGGGGNGGTIYKLPNGLIVYIPIASRIVYIVDRTNTCGISMDAPYPSFSDWAQYNNIISDSQLSIMNLTCDILQPTNKGGNYVCQKLGDPTVTRKCY